MIREYIIKISDEIMEEEIADRPQELVRCKDCQRRAKCGGLYYCTVHESIYPNDDWFCADGERKSLMDTKGVKTE